MSEAKKKVLYVNACIREESRTDRLAKALLAKLGDYEEVTLESEDIKPLNRERLKHRDVLLAKGDIEDESFQLARQFANADIIVVASPYWDTSFSAVLKAYIENIYVVGIVAKYGENGIPMGLCKAEKLYYVTTAGGPYEPEYSYDYLRKLAIDRFGMKDTALIYAEFLDVIGNDPEAILQKAIDEIKM